MKRILPFILIMLLILPGLTSAASSDSFVLKPTMHTYEYLCQTQNMTPISDIDDICRIVTKSKVCEKVPKKDLLQCHSLNKTSQIDAWEFIKGCTNGALNSVKDLLNFFWEIMKWAWNNTTSGDARAKSKGQASEYMAATKLYLNTEYQKALAKSSPPGREMKAIGTMTGAIGKMILNSVTNTVQKNYHEFGCLNFEAKSEYVCNLLGDVLIPPAGFVAFLKYGPKAVKQFPNLKSLYQTEKPKAKTKAKAAAPAPAPKPKGPVTYPSKAFADLAAKNPALAKTFENIDNTLPRGAAKVDSVKDIRYNITKGFRAVSAEEMVKRAGSLEPEHAKSVLAAYNTLNDRKAMQSYMEKLFAESAEWMSKKGRPQDLKNLKNGVVTEQAIAVILVKRMKENGDTKFTKIDYKGIKYGKLDIDPSDIAKSNDQFRTAVRTGPFFDYAFPANTTGARGNHGRYSHMIQRDMIAGALKKSTGGQPQKFWDFMGTKKGINYWVDLFDSMDNNSFTRPEAISIFLNHNLTDRKLSDY